MAVAAVEPAAQMREDELLQALNAVRAAGGVTCGSDAPSAPAPALRLDSRLVCAARVFAADLNITRAQSLTDSQGRGSAQRINAAGYNDNQWAESFAFRSSSASDALSVMLGDAASCPRLVDASYLDVGVAYVGDVNVVSLASE
jgi:uncharacterized protein YkwD